LSTIAVEPIVSRFRLDPQNAVELFHHRAGCILHGGNSQRQPEAGSFLLRHADQTDYLPQRGTIEPLDDGDRLLLQFRSFHAALELRVLSPTHAALLVRIDQAQADQPVTFNFFPGLQPDEQFQADPRCICFRAIAITADRDLQYERDFKTMDPYGLEFSYRHKPLRAHLSLRPHEQLILDIQVHEP
jgi:hypothetical protein